MRKVRTYIVGSLGMLIVLIFGIYVPFINYLEPNDRGIAWNALSGEIYLQDHQGLNFSAPWVLVATVDTRPHRVCITSGAHAAFNCKLVRFVANEYRRFIAVEGFSYYWWSNRFSFNSGYKEEYRGFSDILRGYAFSSEHYPFIEVIADYKDP